MIGILVDEEAAGGDSSNASANRIGEQRAAGIIEEEDKIEMQ